MGSQCVDVLDAQEKGDRQCSSLGLHSNLQGTISHEQAAHGVLLELIPPSVAKSRKSSAMR
jgi:hypothetical protein